MSQSLDSTLVEFEDEEYRYAYAEDFLNAWIATQLVVLREQRKMSQADFGKLIGTKQPGVSRLENVNHSAWKTETLKRIARALGVRLKISFETFGTLIEEDSSFSRESLKRPEFKEDPVFRKQPTEELFTDTLQQLANTPTTGNVARSAPNEPIEIGGIGLRAPRGSRRKTSRKKTGEGRLILFRGADSRALDLVQRGEQQHAARQQAS